MAAISGLTAYPGPGCIVEFLQDNRAVQGFVLEAQAGKVRLLLANRRELSLPVARLLPWSGPSYPGERSRQEMADLLAEHRSRREAAAGRVDVQELWSLAQGEMEKAPADWLAGLVLDTPDVDAVAGFGHALLACKTHFRFQPPDFEIYPADRVAARTVELEAQRERELLSSQGQAFFQTLWDIHIRRRPPLAGREAPDPELARRLAELLRILLADPDDHDSQALWTTLSKGLPQAVRDDPFAPLHLAAAWGLVEPHHNIWLDRAGYDPGNAWAASFATETEAVSAALQALREGPDALPRLDLPFFSIDAASTRDLDDAVCLDPDQPLASDGTLCLHVCIACPAIVWPFDGALDKAVQRRATSLYLPEATHHMLPEALAADQLSLTAGVERPGLVISLAVGPDGALADTAVQAAWVRVAANLHYDDCEAVLDSLATSTAAPDNPAAAFAAPLAALEALSLRLQARRIAQGAVSIEREEPEIVLRGQGESVQVDILPASGAERSQRIVSELMILVNAALARWAAARALPLFHRTQDLAMPKEFAGCWKDPTDIARVLRVLGPAVLETAPRPHAALGLNAYAPSTSPLRRYPDLLNTAQILHCLAHAAPRWTKVELDAALPALNARLEAANQVQRFRPRYWKLLHFKQKGDKVWWDAVITEENDHFVTLALPAAQLTLRARRALLGTRATPGQAVRVRIGKVHPLHNDISVVDAAEG